MAGKFRDPLVGRDILYGMLWGSILTGCFLVGTILPELIGHPSNAPVSPTSDRAFGGIRYFMPVLMDQISASLVQAFLWSFLILLFVVLFRNRLIGTIAGILAISALGFLTVTKLDPISWPIGALAGATLGYTIVRFGLLAGIANLFVFHLVIFLPTTTKLSAWFAENLVLDLIVLSAILVYAVRTSIAGQPLLKRPLLEE